MRSKISTFKRILSAALVMALLIGVLPMTIFSVGIVDADSKVVDPNTMNEWENFFGRTDTAYAGAVWTDKSVFRDASAFADVNKLATGAGTAITVDQNNFLVALSAIASTSVVKGYSTTPTDTMLVLDVSGSMVPEYTAGYRRERGYGYYEYEAVSAVDTSTVEDMVKAANDAINKLLTLNEHNRVGVILYSGSSTTGTSGTSTGQVILPLGRYNGVSANGTVSYLSADLTTQTATLYERVNRDNYQSMGSVTYATDVSISVADGLKTAEGGSVTDAAKTVVGGTYIQNGLYLAYSQFKGRIDANDTTIAAGKVQAGTKRMPIVVLMSDGAPTTSTTQYNQVGQSNVGNGSSSHATAGVGFLTQLTASWVRGKLNSGYGTAPRFYTLGLGDAGTNATGIGVLNPSSASNNASGYWTEFLNPNDGRVTINIPGGDQKTTVTNQKDTTLVKNYVDQYWYANDSAKMIEAFAQIANEIVLQSKYYATLVQSNQHNVDGYITITDEIGEHMEVKKVTGLVLGDTLFSGEEMAHALTTGILGSPGGSTALGDEFVWTVMERLGIEEVSTAQQLINAAYASKQLCAEPASNYIGWYADANGAYLGHWNSAHTAQDYPAGAVYINKSYGYLGKHASNNASDMMHVVVKVSTNIENGHQMVEYQIPASLIPMVTYTVTLDGDSLETAQNITLTSDADAKSPMRLLFEVGLKEGINPVTVKELMTGADHKHENADGSYSFYSNRWAVTDLNDPNNPTGHRVTTAHFEPSKENEYYHFKEAETVLDANGNAVMQLDTSGNTQYYYDRQVVSNTTGTAAKVTNVRMPLSAKDLEHAQLTEGKYVIPKGAVNMPSNDVRIRKATNATGTLDYYSYPYGVHDHNTDNLVMYAFLGNNGTFTVTPATGLKLTKTVSEAVSGAETEFTFTVTLDTAAPNAEVTDENGEPVTGWTLSTDQKVITLRLKDGQTLCVIGLPAGATYTVAEAANDYYTAGITNAAGTVEAQKLIAVDALNSPKQYGDLLIEKEVLYDLGPAPDALSDIPFIFKIVLSGPDIAEGMTFESTMGTLRVYKSGNDLVLFKETGESVILHNEESVLITGLPAGTSYTVTEIEMPYGFEQVSVNGDVNKTAATGEIAADTVAEVDFVNRYQVESPAYLNLNLELTKILNAESPMEAPEDFVFLLERMAPGENGYSEVDRKIVAGLDNRETTRTIHVGLNTQQFSKPGTYYYRITEVPGTTNGMTYSTMQAMFSVVVTDNDLNGSLEAAVNQIANVEIQPGTGGYDWDLIASFTNTYSLTATSTSVAVKKALVNETGVEIPLTNFQFELFAADAQGNIINTNAIQKVTANAAGDAAFTIPVNAAGTFHYVIKEVNAGKAGMTYDPSAYLVTVVSTAGDGGQLSATTTLAKIGENASANVATFTNTYELAGTTVSIPVIKELDGRPLIYDPNNIGPNGYGLDRFLFLLTRTEADFATAHNDATMNGAKWIYLTGEAADAVRMRGSMDPISFTQVGTYYFTLKEAAGDQAGISYDTSEYHITVTVSDNGDGTLKAETVIHKLGEQAPLAAGEVPTFVNKYTVTGEKELELGGTKTLKGRALNPNEFTFELYRDGALRESVTNHAGGKFLFSKLTFTAADVGQTYIYEVKEKIGSLGGVTYTQDVYRVTVTVGHDGLGNVTMDHEIVKIAGQTETQLGADQNMALDFTNTYKTNPVSVTLSGSKNLIDTLNNRLLKDGEFEFELVDPATGAVLQTVKNVNGKFTFQALTYTYTDENVNDLGKHYYVIREKVPADEADRVPGVIYDASTFEIMISVTDLNGEMSANVVVTKPGVGNVDPDNIVFGNRYQVTGKLELALGGTKTLNGRDLEVGEFSFELVAADGTVIETAQNREDKTYGFAVLKYTAADRGKTYTYTVREVAGSLGGVTYSTDVYKITVKIDDDGKGGLTMDYDIVKVVGETETPMADDQNQELNFVNTYAPNGSVELTLSGTKTLVGRALKAGEFSFQLIAADGTVLQTKTNAADGTVTFDALTFTQADIGSTVKYTVQELVPEEKLPGVTYSDEVYEILVTVTDNGNGGIHMSYTVDGDGNTPDRNRKLNFTNTFTAEDVEISLDVVKKIETTAKDPIGPEGFKFTVEDADGNVLGTLVSNADGKAAYTLTFGENQVGTYTYVIREVDTDVTGVTYDTTEYTVVVEITKDAVTGELKAAYRVNGTVAQDAKVTFTNGYEEDTIPETGDSFHVVLMMSSIMLMSLAALAVLVLNRKKEF